jgi:hypothetical protein
MKAFILDRYGSTDGLRARAKMPDPELPEDETGQRAVSFPKLS